MKRRICVFVLLSLSLLVNSCNTTEPPTNENGIDTTSHNFTFQSWTFGEHSSSVLYDIAIVNDTSIWAVGEIYLNDSLGQPDPTPYNAVHWYASAWTVVRIPTKTFSGSIVSAEIRTIFAFNENDIWTFSIAGSYSHWNGTSWQTEFVIERDGSGNKLWGTNSSHLYLVCNNGGITYYNGTSWEKTASGIDVNLTDIYGTPDGNEIWTCGWNNSDGHTILLRIINNQSEIIYDSYNPNKKLPYNGFVSSLWTDGNDHFWLTGISDGVVKHSYKNINIATKLNFDIQYFPYRIRGNKCNDISLVGDASMLWHFNRSNWKRYEELLNVNDRLRSVNMEGNIIVAVGRRYNGILSGGLIIKGKRL